MIHIQNPVYYRKFRHIQAYSRPVQTYSPINCGILDFCVTFAYSEPYHILKPGIFRTRDILRTLLKVYSDIQCTTKRSHIENLVIFRTLLPYSEFWRI